MDVYTDGNAQINTGKIDTYIRGKVEADLDYLQARIEELKDMKKAESAAFDKSLEDGTAYLAIVILKPIK